MSAKTRKSAAKRLRITRKGKVCHHRMGKDHLLVGKNAKRKRRLRQTAVVTGRRARRLALLVKGS